MARVQSERHNPWVPEQSSENHLASYGLRLHPLEEASLSLSATGSRAYAAGRRMQDNGGILSRFHGSPLPALNLSMEWGFLRSNQYPAGREFDTWNFSAAIDGDVTRKVGALSSYGYRVVRENLAGLRMVQHRAGGNLTVRLTHTLFLTGETEVAMDGATRWTQAAGAGWTALPRLNLAWQAHLAGGGRETETRRYVYSANWDFARKGSLYLQHNINRSADAEAPDATVSQIGVRTGF